jgi:hypothetical protein
MKLENAYIDIKGVRHQLVKVFRGDSFKSHWYQTNGATTEEGDTSQRLWKVAAQVGTKAAQNGILGPGWHCFWFWVPADELAPETNEFGEVIP